MNDFSFGLAALGVAYVAGVLTKPAAVAAWAGVKAAAARFAKRVETQAEAGVQAVAKKAADAVKKV